MTPAKAATPPPVRLGSVGKLGALPSVCKTPKEEAALLRQVSDVLKEHLETVTRAAKRCVAARSGDAPATSAR